jgi:hypothetical protein
MGAQFDATDFASSGSGAAAAVRSVLGRKGFAGTRPGRGNPAGAESAGHRGRSRHRATGGIDRHGKILPIIKIVTEAGVETVSDDKLSVVPNSRSMIGFPVSSGTENGARAFSFLITRSDFLTVAVVPALLATPSTALGDLASSAPVTARPSHGDDVLGDHGG